MGEALIAEGDPLEYASMRHSERSEHLALIAEGDPVEYASMRHSERSERLGRRAAAAINEVLQ